MKTTCKNCGCECDAELGMCVDCLGKAAEIAMLCEPQETELINSLFLEQKITPHFYAVSIQATAYQYI